MKSPWIALVAIASLLIADASYAADSGLYEDYHPEGTRLRVAVETGYAGAGFDDIAARYRTAYQKITDSYSGFSGETALATVKGGSGGPVVTADFGYAISSEQGAGVRIGWQSPARIVADFAVDGTFHQESSQYLTSSLWTFLVGGWMERANASDLYLRVTIYAGLGLATMNLTSRYLDRYPWLSSDQSDSATSTWQGLTSLAAQLGLEAGVHVTPGWCLYLAGGYHLARVRAMTATTDTTWSQSGQPYVQKGTVFTDADGSAIPFDFSGFHGTLGMRISL